MNSYVHILVPESLIRMEGPLTPVICNDASTSSSASSLSSSSVAAKENVPRPHICTLCGFGFKTKGNLNEHLNFYHMKGSVACSECPKVFPTSQDLRKHRLEHAALSGRCPHCRTNLVDNKVVELGPETFKDAYSVHIEMCSRKPGKRLSSQTMSTFEMLRKIDWSGVPKHTGPTHCNTCLKIFDNESFLKDHNCPAEYVSSNMEVSGAERCPDENGMDSPEIFDYIGEQDQISNYSSSFCVVCNLNFENENDLSQHLYDNHQNVESLPEVPISAPAPNVLYCYKSPVASGQAPVIDISRKEYPCTFCNKVFESEEAMIDHVESCLFSSQETPTADSAEEVVENTLEKELNNVVNTDLERKSAIPEEEPVLDDIDAIESLDVSNESNIRSNVGKPDTSETADCPETSDVIQDKDCTNASTEEVKMDQCASNDNNDSTKDNSILIRWLCKYCKQSFEDQKQVKSHKKGCAKKSGFSSQVDETEVINSVSAEIMDDNTDIFVRWMCKYCKEQFNDKATIDTHKLECKQKETRRKSIKLIMASDTECSEKESVIASDSESVKKTGDKALVAQSKSKHQQKKGVGEITEDEENSDSFLDLYSELPLISKMTYPCERCFESFDDDDERSSHQVICPKQTLGNGYSCRYCSSVFNTKELQNEHEQLCNKRFGSSGFIGFCKLCNLTFNDMDIYKLHKNKCVVPRKADARKNKIHHCVKCENNFIDLAAFQNHTCLKKYFGNVLCMSCSVSKKIKPNCADCTTLRDEISMSSECVEEEKDLYVDAEFIVEASSKDGKGRSPSSLSSSTQDSDEESELNDYEYAKTRNDTSDQGLITTCSRCSAKFDNLVELAAHCDKCQAKPIPGNFEAFVNRSLPVLRCPSCQLFFRGPEKLVNHKCSNKFTKGSRKRPISDGGADSIEPAQKQATLERTTQPPLLKCSQCNAISKDYSMVVNPTGKQLHCVCLSCCDKQKEFESKDDGTVQDSQKTTSLDINSSSITQNVTLKNDSLSKLATEKTKAGNLKSMPCVNIAKKSTNLVVNITDISPETPAPVMKVVEKSLFSYKLISAPNICNSAVLPSARTILPTGAQKNTKPSTIVVSQQTKLTDIGTPEPRSADLLIRNPAVTIRNPTAGTITPMIIGRNQQTIVATNIANFPKQPFNSKPNKKAQKFTQANKQQSFVALIPVTPTTATVTSPSSIHTLAPPHSGIIRFLSPRNPSFQTAGNQFMTNAKPMPGLRLGNPRMIFRPDAQPAQNVNESDQNDSNGMNRLSMDKENQRRLPLSNVDDCDGWLLEGVLNDNTSNVVVKKCICGNCYLSFIGEDALTEHAWTVHKRLITEALRLKKIENVTQMVMKKALSFANDCAVKSS